MVVIVEAAIFGGLRVLIMNYISNLWEEAKDVYKT